MEKYIRAFDNDEIDNIEEMCRGCRIKNISDDAFAMVDCFDGLAWLYGEVLEMRMPFCSCYSKIP